MFSALLLAFTVSLGWASEAGPRYVGSTTTEAWLEYDGRVLRVPGVSLDEKAARARVDAQVKYLSSQMRRERYGSRQTSYQISNLVIGPKEITYHFRGKFMLSRNFKQVALLLPLRLEQKKKACWDSDEADLSVYWYYWNPFVKGCDQKLGVDYVFVPTKIQRLPNTKKSYPEYARLVDENRVIPISIFCGKDKLGGTNALETSTDFGAQDCRMIQSLLRARGYVERAWSEAEIRSVAPGKLGELPRVSEYLFVGRNAQIRIRLFFGDTRFVSNPRAFHYFLKSALENDSVVFYNGHAGIGKNLDLAGIEKRRAFRIELPRDRYQIFQMFGCFTYQYYAEPYLARKGGKNLDILSNGVEGFFGNAGTMGLLILNAIESWVKAGHRTSYQEIAAQLLRFDPQDFGLFSVSGDEDNP